MNFRLKRYKKGFEHSYTFGVFPTLELLTNRLQDVLGVVIHPKGRENTGITKIQEICQKSGTPLEIQEKTFARLGARENDFAIGVFRKNEPDLDASANHVILVNPSGMGNLGTIIRTMLGFDFRNLAIITPAVDIFHPEVVRASMGALFRLRFAHFENIAAYRKTNRHHIYPLMTDGESLLRDTNFEPPYGLVFGNESRGLGPEYQDIGTTVNIPQSKAIDSLNLAVSVGVTLYQASLTAK